MQVGFSEKFRRLAEDVPKMATLVLQMSAKDLVHDMQNPKNGPFHVGAGTGKMPVDTEFLRASLLASSVSMPAMIAGHQPHVRKHYPYDPKPIHAVIDAAKFGDPLYFGYQADYAAYQNYGTSKMAGNRFRDLAVQKWPTFVTRNASKVRQMFGM